ncbi:MAG: hypothetical protein LBF85_02335, partial [Tannerella sp.]|nr:hypothetical protein [Tannerella sp.]
MREKFETCYCQAMKRLFFFLVCILLPGGKMYSQDVDLQDLVNQKQYEAAVDYATRLRQADSADYRTMYAV